MSSGSVYVSNIPLQSVPTDANGNSILGTYDEVKVIPYDGLNNKSIDAATASLLAIDYPHHEIHGGSAYYSTYTATVDDTNDIEIRIGTPDTTKWAHFEFIVSATGETDFDFYEGTSFTHNASNAITAFNRNRNSSNTSGLTICHTPSGSGDGTKIGGAIFGLDTGTGATRIFFGGGADTRQELVLKQNTAYLLRVASGTDGNRISIVFEWYEHTNKA